MYHCAWSEVTWLPMDGTSSNVTWPRSEFPCEGGVRACATGSCALSTLLRHFHRKWRHHTSHDPEGDSIGKVGCVEAQLEVALYPPWDLFTGSDVIKRQVIPKGFRLKNGMGACATGSMVFIPVKYRSAYARPKRKGKEKKVNAAYNIFSYSQSQAWIKAEWLSIGWLMGSNVPFHSFEF